MRVWRRSLSLRLAGRLPLQGARCLGRRRSSTRDWSIESPRRSGEIRGLQSFSAGTMRMGMLSSSRLRRTGDGPGNVCTREDDDCRGVSWSNPERRCGIETRFSGRAGSGGESQHHRERGQDSCRRDAGVGEELEVGTDERRRALEACDAHDGGENRIEPA